MSFFGGDVHLWCQWPGNASNGKFVSSRVVIAKWPNLLYRFLESNLRFNAPVPIRIGKYGRPEGAVSYTGRRMQTRSKTHNINAHGFNALVPSIPIRRRPNYDVLLLIRPSVGVNRRRTLAPAAQPTVPIEQTRTRRVTFADPISLQRIRTPSPSPSPSTTLELQVRSSVPTNSQGNSRYIFNKTLPKNDLLSIFLLIPVNSFEFFAPQASTADNAAMTTDASSTTSKTSDGVAATDQARSLADHSSFDSGNSSALMCIK